MTTRKYAPAVVAAALALTACGQSDFRDEADKRDAFAQRQCKEYLQMWDGADETLRTSHISTIAAAVQADKRNEPAARRDAGEIYRQTLLRARGNTAPMDIDGPGFQVRADPSRDSGCADTWLWEWTLHQDYDSDKYARFTWDDAVNAGVR